jgi:hypothetical protein
VDLSTNVAGRALAMSQPVLVKVDQIAGLDSKGDKALALVCSFSVFSLPRFGTGPFPRNAVAPRGRNTIHSASLCHF